MRTIIKRIISMACGRVASSVSRVWNSVTFLLQDRHVGMNFDGMIIVHGIEHLFQIPFMDPQVMQFATNQARITITFCDEGNTKGH